MKYKIKFDVYYLNTFHKYVGRNFNGKFQGFSRINIDILRIFWYLTIISFFNFGYILYSDNLNSFYFHYTKKLSVTYNKIEYCAFLEK